MKWKKLAALMLGALLCIAALSGCGNDAAGNASGGKTLTIGDTTFNSSNEEPDINPPQRYAGWPVSATVLARRWSSTPIPWNYNLGWLQSGKIPIP